MADTATHPGRADRRSRYTIAHILPFPSVGGTEHATLRIAQAIDPKRFTSVAFCLRDAERVRAFVTAAGLPCLPYDEPVPSYLHAAAFLRASQRLARELVRANVDLVHCANLLAAYHGALAGRLAGLPIVCHIRGRFEDISARDRSFLWPVRKFLFVSENTWRHFGYKVAPGRGAVVYDAVDVPPGTETGGDRCGVRRELGISAGAPIVGMMARLAPEKDFATLARAAARVRQSQPDVKFVVVGDFTAEGNREHYQTVRQDLEACGVADAFIFTGFRTDVARFLDAFDIFVLSTHREGLPLVILEAMARGTPVIATAVDGIPEIITDGENGRLVPHEDHERLSAHICDLLRDPRRARQLGEAGRRLVGTRFSNARFAQQMTEVYEGLVGDGRRRPAGS